MSFRVFARWVRSWLRVRGSRSPHLFPICSGGRRRFYVPLVAAAPRPVFSYWLWWPALPVPVRVLGLPVLVFFVTFLLFILFVYFLYLYYACPSLNCPVGLCFWTHDMTSDWLPSGFPPRLPGHCRLVLTGSHDSLFLWYPAIDIVWLGPVFLALGIPESPCSPQLRSVVSESW